MASATNTGLAGGHGPERNTKQGMTLLDITEISITVAITLSAALVAASGIINERCKQITIIPTTGNFYWSVADSGDPTIVNPFTLGLSIPFKAQSAPYLRLKSTSGTCVIQVIQMG